MLWATVGSGCEAGAVVVVEIVGGVVEWELAVDVLDDFGVREDFLDSLAPAFRQPARFSRVSACTTGDGFEASVDGVAAFASGVEAAAFGSGVGAGCVCAAGGVAGGAGCGLLAK